MTEDNHKKIMEDLESSLNNTTVQNDFVRTTENIKYSLMSLVPQWSRDIFTVFMVVVFVIGLSGNALVIIVQSRVIRKNATDWFVTFLAICDILSVLICVPSFTLSSRGLWSTVGNSIWCKLHFFNIYVCFIGSVLIIDCLCIERYNKTTGNVNGKTTFTPNLALATGGVSMFVAALIGTTAFVTTDNNSAGQCIYVPEWHHVQIYVHGIVLLLVICSCILIGFLYTKIIVVFKRSSKVTPILRMDSNNELEIQRINSLRSKTLKTTKIIGVITFVFVTTSCLPVLAVIPLSTPGFISKTYGRVTVLFLTRIYMLNNFMNPVFYLWLYPAFRRKAFNVYLEMCGSFNK